MLTVIACMQVPASPAGDRQETKAPEHHLSRRPIHPVILRPLPACQGGTAGPALARASSATAICAASAGTSDRRQDAEAGAAAR